MTFDPRPYEKLVHSHLRKLMPFCKGALCKDDLLQVGLLAICKAHGKFDPNRGVKFETYANYWVRQRLWQEIAAMGYPVRFPATSYTKVRKERGPVPFGASLDQERGDDGEGYTMLDYIPDTNAMPQDEEAMLAAMVAMTSELVGSVCNDRETDITVSCGQGETLASAARRHGISRERARQLYERSLERVRKSPRLHELAEFLEAS